MRQKLLAVQISTILAMLAANSALAADDTESIEEVTVWGQSAQPNGTMAHPGSLLTQQDLVNINARTHAQFWSCKAT